MIYLIQLYLINVASQLSGPLMLSNIKGPLLASSLNICHILDIANPLAIFAKIANFAKTASLRGVGTFFAIIASPPLAPKVWLKAS